MALNEWHTRKIGIDVMYTIAAILGDVLAPYTKEIYEVLNHCRFDKMKPVREAAIEAINLIKEIDPSVVEDQSQESYAKNRNSRVPQGEKPWKKKQKTKQPEEGSTPFGSYSNKDPYEENLPEKKISTATKKRREAQEAKKKIQPAK